MSKRTIDLTKEAALGITVFIFWIAVWAIGALIVGDSYFLPSPLDTLKALFLLLKEAYFYKVILASLLRVLLGLFLGVSVGVLLATLCNLSSTLRSFVSPIISIFKAMPVATFILILWVIMWGSKLTVFIGFMMVLPIIYQNTLDGFDSIDKGLREAAVIYELSFFKKLRLLYFPTILSYLAPALVTSIGLAFKSQIAAEIIAYTHNSIGQYIFDANYNLNTEKVFAWAVVIVIFSISLESLTKFLVRRMKNGT